MKGRVKKFISNSNSAAHEQSYRSSGGPKYISGNHHPPPSSYSQHHLLQSPEIEEEEETIFNSYQDQHLMKAVLECNSKLNDPTGESISTSNTNEREEFIEMQNSVIEQSMCSKG